MIFITLGSQKFQFNRLLAKIDELIENGTIMDKVFAQVGFSDYIPKHYTYKSFLDHDEFSRMEKEASIVITHGGTGAIVGAIKQGKKVIAVPRLAKFGEHVDNHQLQLIAEFNQQNLILGLDDCDELDTAIAKVKTHEYSKYVSNTVNVIESLRRDIER